LYPPEAVRCEHQAWTGISTLIYQAVSNTYHSPFSAARVRSEAVWAQGVPNPIRCQGTLIHKYCGRAKNYREAAVIEYRVGNDLDLDVAIDLYRSSTLGERRPLDDRERMTTMLRNANLVVTAWDRDLLVGISRALSDFSYATYLSDLAVRDSHQRSGIGKELIRRTREEAPQTMLVLLAAPAAVGYYPRVGFTQHPSAWFLKPGQEMR
jgi:GNAT superfamily N-acetyltransferase